MKKIYYTAFSTEKSVKTKYKGIVEKIAVLFWFIIPAAFISIPVYFGFIK